ncbi:Hypothetical protein NTJ_04176 [Nesidiocoris tenuis]|uniref:Uncharacterized protein n=1 Tax=Nesidiocoris tenuis TaxID=355587 RepID=A0ABN7AH53_9HEMI|nr:Hypothetical protein NTJ_04176 [Nesidiocoris tenuis]
MFPGPVIARTEFRPPRTDSCPQSPLIPAAGTAALNYFQEANPGGIPAYVALSLASVSLAPAIFLARPLTHTLTPSVFLILVIIALFFESFVRFSPVSANVIKQQL